MILGLFCCDVNIPKIVDDFCNIVRSRLGGAALKMNVCAFPCEPADPDEDQTTRLKALKKFAWNCKSMRSVMKKRFETDRSSLKYHGILREENRFGASPNSPGGGATNAAGLI